jgi:hypothetical protein
MRDLEFSEADIENLAGKLSAIEHRLTDHERDLLLAIFAAAADRARPAGQHRPATLRAAQISARPETDAENQVTSEELRDQLLKAYAPGNDFVFVTSRKISGVKKPPHQPPATGD